MAATVRALAPYQEVALSIARRRRHGPIARCRRRPSVRVRARVGVSPRRGRTRARRRRSGAARRSAGRAGRGSPCGSPGDPPPSRSRRPQRGWCV
jgi:hypothetical protein